jgi:two-component system, OmpR family, sensor histidine kinase KdpD
MRAAWWMRLRPLPDWRYLDVLVAAATLAVATTLMLLVRQHLNVLNVSLLYLILVVLVALLARHWTSIATAVVAFLLSDFFFVKPYYTLSVARINHLLTLFVFLGVATLTSQLVYRIRLRTLEALERGRRMETLYGLSQSLIGDVSLEPMLAAIAQRVVGLLGVGACALLLPDEQGQLVVRAGIGQLPDPSDRDDAGLLRWAFEHGEPAASGPGWGRVIVPRPQRGSGRRRVTQRVPTRRLAALYIPISAGQRAIGVMRVAQPAEGGRFSAEDQQLLATFANQAALALERVRLADQATRAAVLERSDQLKSALLSAVSHDLRTPLASIKASATSLLQQDIVWSPADQRDLLQAIDEETDRLTRLIGNLLDLSRIEAGVLRPQRDWNDVAELVAETLARLTPTLGAREVALELEPDLPLARFDYIEIAQVLVNLLENAAKYSATDAPIAVGARRAGDALELTVADRGVGVPVGEEARVFEKFYRVANRPGTAGAGIGLSVSQGLVEAHGGRIWVTDREGGGAIFHFTLPLLDIHPEEQEQP